MAKIGRPLREWDEPCTNPALQPVPALVPVEPNPQEPVPVPVEVPV